MDPICLGRKSGERRGKGRKGERSRKQEEDETFGQVEEEKSHAQRVKLFAVKSSFFLPLLQNQKAVSKHTLSFLSS